MRDSSKGTRAQRRRREIRLAELVPNARFIGCDDIVVSSVQDVAARCRPGDVFVARMTARGDGHESVPQALARGAVAVIAERIVPTDGRPLCLVPDADQTHARLCHAIAGDPSREMRVIAVAGTSGKTTTAWLTAAALSEIGHRVGVVSDLGCLGPDDSEPEAIEVTTAPRLAAALARLSAAGCSHVVVEVSSGMLAARATAGLVADTVAVTGLSPAHLDRHATPGAYRSIVTRVMETLAGDGCLVTSVAEQDRLSLIAAGPVSARVLLAGLDPSADVHAHPLEGDLFGRTFLLEAGGQIVPVAVDTPTVPYVRDVVFAAAIASRYGVSLEHAARGIEAAGSVPGRLERIDRGQDAVVFIDMPSSLHAVASSLASLRRLTPGRLAVIVDERLAHRLAGAGFAGRVARWADDCLIAPESIADEDPAATDVAAYARLDRLLSRVRQGDCVVVMGTPVGGPAPDGPWGQRSALAVLVDGWLQLAHPAEAAFAGRRAA